MKTPISYYGGKQRLASKIVKLIPKHTVYVEPFVGGGAVFHAKPLPSVRSGNQYREVINDLDEQLVNCYRNAHKLELIEMLQATPYSRSVYDQARHICKHQNGYTEVERACAYFVNINMSFGNVDHGGWGYGIKGRNLAATWSNRLLRLAEWKQRLEGVCIECDDAVEIIKRWDGPQTFFYCDPPYPGTYQDYKHKYLIEELQLLVDTLSNIKGSFILSNYHQDIDFPNHWERFEFSSRMSSANGKNRKNVQRTEIVWRCINRDIPDWCRKLYDTGKYDCFVGDYQDRQGKLF